MPHADDKPALSRNTLEKFMRTVFCMLDCPVTWTRASIEAFQTSYPWYHQKFPRVPTIDRCYTDDIVCYSEANWQYKRDRQVDTEILSILRKRFEDCTMYEAPDHIRKCEPILQQYEEASVNWFIKYGDLGGYHNVKTAFMKQKHRLLWEKKKRHHHHKQHHQHGVEVEEVDEDCKRCAEKQEAKRKEASN